MASRPLPSDYADDMNEFGRLLTGGGGKKGKKGCKIGTGGFNT